MQNKNENISSVVPTTEAHVGTVGTMITNDVGDGNIGCIRGNEQRSEEQRLDATVPKVPSVPTASEETEQERTECLELEASVRRFVQDLSTRYATLPRFRTTVLSLVRTSLPKSAGGRPRLDEVTKALELRDRGWDWATVYPMVIRKYGELPPHERQFRQRQLRDRARQRRYILRRRVQLPRQSSKK